MSAGLAAIGPRLAKLLPMLGSDQPGEVMAAVQAIGRTLSGAGLDWHNLAALIAAEAKRNGTPAFSFANLAPRTARKQMALLAQRPGLSVADRVRLERLRQWLHRQAVAVRLPTDHLEWIDALWRQSFGE